MTFSSCLTSVAIHRIKCSRMLLAACLATLLACTSAIRPGTQHADINTKARMESTCMVHPKMSGYLPVDKKNSLYFAYFEREPTSAEDEGPAPIILWLQGGPGCASTFGLFYELGPFWLSDDLCLDPNPGAWTKLAGLLIIDQPLGTGLSFAVNSSDIPRDELGMATHLYTALQHFFNRYWRLQSRPFFIAGESYGGKYVPSLAHFILQVHRQHQLAAATQQNEPHSMIQLQHHRRLPDNLSPPLFKLAGIAVGNGLTAPREQTLQLAQTAHWVGVMDTATADDMQQRVEQVVSLIDSEQWEEAHTVREDLRGNITELAGLSTMFDTRRTVDYDPHKAVDEYLNDLDVRDSLRANRKGQYITCSDEVGSIMAADVMQSVKHLVPDLLQNIHVLLYQGNFDILDGPASNSHWIEAMEWPLKDEFNKLPSKLWKCHGSCLPPIDTGSRVAPHASGTGPDALAKPSGAGFDTLALPSGAAPQLSRGVGKWNGKNASHVGGWWRQAGKLTHAVVYRAGHMVPRDQPIAMHRLLEQWLLKVLDDESQQQ